MQQEDITLTKQEKTGRDEPTENHTENEQILQLTQRSISKLGENTLKVDKVQRDGENGGWDGAKEDETSTLGRETIIHREDERQGLRSGQY